MASLEYLTDNSLTAYPFKTRKAVYSFSANPIQDDWFYDILFASFAAHIRSVYLSSVEKSSWGDLKLVFSNAETAEALNEINISSADLVNHLGNKEVSFFGYSCTDFAVKILFGPGLLEAPEFNQTYTVIESELASSAVILPPPRVQKITFASYLPSYTVVKEYSYPEVPTVRPSHNTAFVLESLNAGGLFVDSGLGDGLYDNCPTPGAITDVYTLSTVAPNDIGAIFLTASSCYSVNTLSENDTILLGSDDPAGYLYKYHYFNTNREDVPVFDAVVPDHSLFIQNYCKPKCPPENLNAFAYYLNRITDGVAELDKIVAGNTEIRGRGSPRDSDPTLFDCYNFCVSVHNGEVDPFDRCSDPADEGSYIQCGTQFDGYFHEGRTLRIHYSALVVRDYTILEVISSETVRLNIPPTITGADLWFKVFDNGVISNMNCAASYYNAIAATYTKPYFKVKYTTSEAFNTEGNYVTYVSVVVAVFNPSPESAPIRVDFNPVNLTREGSFKVRTEKDVNIVSIPAVTLECRQYAFIEGVYFIACGLTGAQLTATVFLVDGTTETIIAQPHVIQNVSGAPCPGTLAGSASLFRTTESTIASFQAVIPLSEAVTSASLYGDIPFWLMFRADYTASVAYMTSRAGVPPGSISKRSTMYIKSYGGIDGAISKVSLDYVAYPRITSPLASGFTALTPLVIVRGVLYTESLPIIRIIATNMTLASGDFPEDPGNFKYRITRLGLDPALPEGLILNEDTGVLHGQMPTNSTDDYIQLSITAQNSAGGAVNPQEIFVVAVTHNTPEVSIVSPPQNNLFSVSNLDIFNSSSPLFLVEATNPPIRGYSLLGDLPAGLHFNQASGIVTGRITETTSGQAYHLGLSAINAYGESSLVYFTIDYIAYQQPSILYPANASIVYGLSDATTTLSAPLFTITALQGFGGTDNYADGLTDTTRNKYTASGLPAGLVIDLYTGKVYGKLQGDPGGWYNQYAVRIYATNPAGRQTSDITLVRSVSVTPSINNVASGRVLNVIKNRIYTANASLLKIGATNSPLNFYATGLPAGLTCLTSGEIIGVIPSSAASADYAVALTASNNIGTSDPLNCIVRTPVSILSPYMGQSFNVSTTEEQPVFTIGICDLPAEELLTITTSTLPAGLTLTGNTIAGKINTPGTYSIEVAASTVNHGSDKVSVILAAAAVTYSITGTVTNTTTEAPIASALVSTLGKRYTTITDAFGAYTLTGLSTTGSYDVSIQKTNYQFSPALKYVNVTAGEAVVADFTGTGPYISLSGKIRSAEGQPLPSVLVSTSTTTATTNANGEYSLLTLPNSSRTITPTAPGYGFSPISFTVAVGEVQIVEINFTSFPATAPGLPGIVEVIPASEALIVSYEPPADNGGATISSYQYNLDGTGVWLTGLINFETQYMTIPNLISGVSYSIRIRAVNSAGTGEQSIAVTAIPL